MTRATREVRTAVSGDDTRNAGATLLERDREVQALDGAVTSARAGAGRLVVIEGGDGMGKSALIVEAGRRARAGGLRALSVRGRPREQDAPFELLRRLFAPVVAACGATIRDELFAGAAAPAALLFSGTAPEDDPGAGVERGDALVHALRLVAFRIGDLDRTRRPRGPIAGNTRRPGLAILVDDAQWVDWCSLRVLVALAAEISTAPIALVCSCPPHPTSTTAGLLQRLHAAATITLTPEPLSTAAVAGALHAAAHGMSRSDADRWVADHVQDAAGTPLLLGELIAEGPPPRGRRPSSGAPPRELSLRALAARTMARIEALPASARAVATALAVLGDESTDAEAAALAELDPPAFDRSVAHLVAARILASPGLASGGDDPRLRFAHPLIGAAVRSGLDPTERVRAHRRAARVRHAAGATPAVVAFHLASCPPTGDSEAAAWLAEAVRHAAGLGHFRAIRELTDRTLAEGPPPELARRMRFDRALAGAALGATDAADQLEQVLRETADGIHRAALLLALGRVLFTSKRFDEAGGALARARAEAHGSDDGTWEDGGAAPSPLTWRLLRDELATAVFRPGARAEIAARLPALVSESADVTGAGAGLVAQYAVQRAASGAPCAEVRDLAVRGLGGEEEGAGAQPGFADLGVNGDCFYDLRTGMSVMALLAVDEFDLAHTAIEKVLIRAQDNGSLIGLGFASHWRALLRLRRGRLLGAVSDAERTLGVCRIGWDVCRNSVVPILVAAHLEGGRVDAAVRALAQTDPLDPDGDPVITQPGLVLEARGHVATARGQWVEAHRLFLEAGAREREQTGIDPSPTTVPWRSDAAAAAARSGRVDEARRLAGEEVEIARAIGAPRCLAVALRVAGVVAGGGNGRVLLREAVDLLEDSQATVDRARVLLDYGIALVGHATPGPDRQTARDVLHDALLLAERAGAHPLAERAVQALRAVGGRRPPDPASARSSRTVIELTRSERHVAELAADHLSTPAIARTLYVSPKTVEWHLTNAYRKLGVRSRRDLLAALTDSRPTG